MGIEKKHRIRKEISLFIGVLFYPKQQIVSIAKVEFAIQQN